MADPTKIVDRTASTYATMMGEEWDLITAERKLLWRALAFRAYELHAKNRLDAMQQCIEVVESVQTAPSTPKGWLRGAQEAKNALVLFHLEAIEDLTTRPTIPEFVPDGLDAEDPYKSARAGDLEPEVVPRGQQCGAMHEDSWECTRAKHPDHWIHWDSDLGEGYDYEEDEEGLKGVIIATWFNDQRLDSLHPAVGELEEE